MEDFINDYEAACAKLGRSTELPDVSMHTEIVGRREIAAHKLDVITEANNGEWKADMADTSQAKWHPWFWVHKDESKPAGFRLAFYDAVFVSDIAFLGARHACKSKPLAIFLGQNCTELYEDLKAA